MSWSSVIKHTLLRRVLVTPLLVKNEFIVTNSNVFVIAKRKQLEVHSTKRKTNDTNVGSYSDHPRPELENTSRFIYFHFSLPLLWRPTNELSVRFDLVSQRRFFPSLLTLTCFFLPLQLNQAQNRL